jgi:hypothetical protein
MSLLVSAYLEALSLNQPNMLAERLQRRCVDCTAVHTKLSDHVFQAYRSGG